MQLQVFCTTFPIHKLVVVSFNCCTKPHAKAACSYPNLLFLLTQSVELIEKKT